MTTRVFPLHMTGTLVVALALCSCAPTKQTGERTADAAQPQNEDAQPPAAKAVAEPPVQVAPNITIQREPSCTPQAKRDSGGQAWLALPAIQADVYALDTHLQPYKEAVLGTVLDTERRRALVVFQQDFGAYEAAAKHLRGRIQTLPVVLLPACHSRAQIAEAKSLLEARAWHPQAGATNMGFWLDPAFAGFAVTLHPSATEVAEALRHSLGDLVQVSFGTARRN